MIASLAGKFITLMSLGVSTTQALILAAGNSSRMNSQLPKVVHRVGGLELINHNLLLLQELGFEEAVMVCGPQLDFVDVTHISVRKVFQREKKGTAHAVKCALPELHSRNVLILYGDVPLISKGTIEALLESQEKYDATLLGFPVMDSSSEYGRLMITEGKVSRIIEYSELEGEQKQVLNFANSGILCIDVKLLKEYISLVDASNRQGEYYLTDVVNLMARDSRNVGFNIIQESEGIGINTQADLSRAERFFQERKRARFLSAGVRLIDPDTVYFAYDTYIESDVIVHPNVIFFPGVKVFRGAEILPFSLLEGVAIGSAAKVGPFARIRGSSDIGGNAVIGNFVEVKNSTIGQGVKVKHLSYIGDASIGDQTNIGGGTVICNFDFEKKHHTQIDKKCFIGGNNTIVAPVRIHAEARTAAGSTITSDVPPKKLGISRAMQVNKSIK
ncbi:UDP-N-acetylglucosamine diphosphorylase/glucosamine-1-phosphate N-acetyltransferase [Neorickettsia helminthoeca str. Oregon]|uniref:Bifunctional protein GlmU n=2 Tax=Neorickettsia helminthoeca TaxID=33994 RepID=X5HJ89_9RICK|nr:UDP-N-acetylglucosamine diphosphorylase/glucosamine-1-phosphate N-acetyltransferase [Neorickettsia helminthoeca str. Oregon]